MNKNRLAIVLTTAALTVASIAGGAGAANATTEYPQGGTWQYGVHEPSSTILVYSNYHHPSKKHRSTACNKNSCSRSADKGANVWSYASITASGSIFDGNGNTAYYHVY